jgi:Secretion system C-terminal sorting domain
LILVIVIPSYSQSNADYFPHKKNNYWEYDFLAGPFGQPDTIVSFSVFDSTNNQGNKISIFDSHFINPIAPPVMLPDSGMYIIDSSYNVFSNAEPIGYNEYSLIYKLNGVQGDQWVIYNYSLIGGLGYEMARIKEIYNDIVLGVPTELMLIHYFYAPDSTDTTGLGRGGDVLAKGFGLQSRQREGWTGIILKGAVIDGVLYGDTTVVSVERNHKTVSSDFELLQNYPNPFNPVTTISYSIPITGLVTLKIFDVLGNEISTLINEEKNSGTYSINFDASNLLSGVYFYTLSVGEFHQTKKFVLLK